MDLKNGTVRAGRNPFPLIGADRLALRSSREVLRTHYQSQERGRVKEEKATVLKQVAQMTTTTLREQAKENKFEVITFQLRSRLQSWSGNLGLGKHRKIWMVEVLRVQEDQIREKVGENSCVMQVFCFTPRFSKMWQTATRMRWSTFITNHTHFPSSDGSSPIPFGK